MLNGIVSKCRRHGNLKKENVMTVKCRRSGTRLRCKICHKADVYKYYCKHKNRLREWKKIYYQGKKEAIKSRSAEWRAANDARKKARNRLYVKSLPNAYIKTVLRIKSGEEIPSEIIEFKRVLLKLTRVMKEKRK